MNHKIFIVLLLFSLCFTSCQDTIVEPENQFVQIYMNYGFKNELNTFKNTYQKDLVLEGVKKVRFWLTEEEQNKILEKANIVNYFSMPDTFKYNPQDSINVIINPDPGEQILRIKYMSKDKTTIWTFPILESKTDFNNLLELRQFIITIIESKPEYRKLPPSRGGND